jgi:hypothetical protein
MHSISRARTARTTRTEHAAIHGPRRTPSHDTVVSGMEREDKRSKRTLSAEVTEALARELRRLRLQELVTSYEQEKGTITAKELAAIQAEWLD